MGLTLGGASNPCNFGGVSQIRETSGDVCGEGGDNVVCDKPAGASAACVTVVSLDTCEGSCKTSDGGGVEGESNVVWKEPVGASATGVPVISPGPREVSTAIMLRSTTVLRLELNFLRRLTKRAFVRKLNPCVLVGKPSDTLLAETLPLWPGRSDSGG